MKPPFGKEEFLQVFANYNTSVRPVQIIILQLALLVIYFAVKKNKVSDKFISISLAFLWLWMGIVYHIIYFSTINKAAYLFGALYIVQAMLFLYYGVMKTSLSFNFRKDISGIAGTVLIVYAIIIYPLIGYLSGHVYPKAPTFGLPCPTTIFTFGILLWTANRVPFLVFIIPLLWSVIGFSAVLYFGMYEDIGLVVSGIISVILFFTMQRSIKKKVLA
ncbi:MAG TPA: DUF6064 family protein [Ignavibacteria bacterium]|jgi:hypothetical protein